MLVSLSVAIYDKNGVEVSSNKLTSTQSNIQEDISVVDQWYSKARVGMFYTWGFAVGGKGSSSLAHKLPPKYMNIDEFEKDAPSANVFAKNLVAVTKRVGARYLIITLHHSCNGHMVIFPTKNEMFIHKTKEDYLGSIIKEAHENNIKVIGYTSGGPGHWNTHGQIWLNGISGDPIDKKSWRSTENMRYYMKQHRLFFEEIKERYASIGGLDGVWVDGCIPWSEAPYNGFQMLREIFPDAILTGNNQQQFPYPEMNIAAAEFVLPELMDPPYNRPSGLTRPREKWRPSVQLRNDYVEDIPAVNGWWYSGEGKLRKDYKDNPNFWVKQMICSLGQRGKWNFATGMGIKIDGSAADETKPLIEAMERFMEWASPAIYNTEGGLGSTIYPGWLNGGAFSSVTKSISESNVYYLLVTEAPSNPNWPIDMLLVQNDNIQKIESITDLRTGKPQPYELRGVLKIKDINWSDINEYGAKVFKIVLTK